MVLEKDLKSKRGDEDVTMNSMDSDEQLSKNKKIRFKKRVLK